MKDNDSIQLSFDSDLLKKIDPDKPYYLGFDIGTASIGWAVTDPSYNVIKRNGKALWGSFLFDEGKTAKDRRLFRAARRRRKRTVYRLNLLRKYFEDEISPIDPGFCDRLQESFLHPKDKKINQKNTLFNDHDPDYMDKDFHRQYPTIYHLRRELMNSEEAHDPRLVYLAVHHILKNRGNFLYQIDANNAFNLKSIFAEDIKSLNRSFHDMYGHGLYEDEKISKVEEILSSSETSTQKTKALEDCLSEKAKDTTPGKEFNKLIVGNQANFKKLFPDHEAAGTNPNQINFSKGNYDEDKTQNELFASLDEDQKDLMDLAYRLYESAILQKMLADKNGEKFDTLSDARVAIYEKHEEDLCKLKNAVKLIDEKEKTKAEDRYYYKVFRLSAKNVDNYVAYSKHADGSAKTSPVYSCNHHSFLSYLSKILKPHREIQEIDKILEEVDQGVFLPKISSSDNGQIPYQLHLIELKEILKNASKYLDSFKANPNKAEEILQIFTFKIPYYVGPLNTESKFAWLKKRKPGETITPWNFKEVVDIPKTAEAFVRKMTNTCTYLVGEKVLPKNSLLYSEFMVRNALNMLTVDGKRLDKDLIDYLYEELFVKEPKEPTRGRISKKRIASALKSKKSDISSEQIGGMDREIAAKLTTLHDFKGIVQNKLSDKEIEEIIEKLTLFPDSQKIVKKYLKDTYAGKLKLELKKQAGELNSEQLEKEVEEIIRKLTNLRYKGWGRFSRKFLAGMKTEIKGREFTIMDILRENPLNPNEPLILVEILNKKEFNFDGIISKMNDDKIKEPYNISDEDLDNLKLSPAVKKSVFNTLKITKEIIKIMGSSPSKIFVEMARGSGPKGRPGSRKSQLEALYKACDHDVKLWNEELKNMGEDVFKQKAVYLYALQKGKDLYTGEAIDINKIHGQRSEYDIDHIYPRSKIKKDDSWDNLVLVNQADNRAKGSDIVPERIRRTCTPLWKELRNTGFMSEEKYKRLTRSTPLNSEDLKHFIDRQLVETRQSTKALAHTFERLFEKNKKTKVNYVKAALVSDFRYEDGKRDRAKTEFFFPKNREVNDLHHAKDAYLNIVVGNVYSTKFTEKFWKDFDENPDNNFSFTTLFDRDIKSSNDTFAWKAGADGSISTVNKMMNRNNILLNYQYHRRTGNFYKQQLLKKGNGQYPIKTHNPALLDTRKYGAYNSILTSHFCIAKYKVKSKSGPKYKEKISILGVPYLLKDKNFSTESIISYFEKQGYADIKIICDEIKINTLIQLDNMMYRLLSKSGSSRLLLASPIVALYNSDQTKKINHILKVRDGAPPQDHTENDCKEIFEVLLKKLTQTPIGTYYTDFVKKIITHKGTFEELKVNNKAKVVMNIITMLNGKGASADLTVLGLGGKVGKITANATRKQDETIKIIHKSITGFYTRVEEVHL